MLLLSPRLPASSRCRDTPIVTITERIRNISTGKADTGICDYDAMLAPSACRPVTGIDSVVEVVCLKSEVLRNTYSG